MTLPEAPGTHCARPVVLIVAIAAEPAPIKAQPPEYGGWNVS
jgi:hypothetical protein